MATKRIIFYRGSHFTVECAISAKGASESNDFLLGLDKKLKAKITAIITRFADLGKIVNSEHFKKVEGDFWEFKHYQTRIIMYYCEQGHIALTNGFIKKTKKTPKSEIERAKRIKTEYDKIREEMRHE